MTIGTISPREAQTLVAQGAKLIDIRDADEYLHEHIPEAHLAPLPALEQGSLPANLQNAATKLSAIAAPAQVWLLEGGIDGWKAAGLPVAKDSSQPLPLMRQVQITAGSLALLGVILGYAVNSGFFLLSGFVGAGLILAGVTGFCGMARLLDKMPWNRRTH